MLEIQRIVEQFTVSVGDNLLQLLAAFGVLILGWLVALIISAGFRGALKRLKINPINTSSADPKRLNLFLRTEGFENRMIGIITPMMISIQKSMLGKSPLNKRDVSFDAMRSITLISR